LFINKRETEFRKNGLTKIMRSESTAQRSFGRGQKTVFLIEHFIAKAIFLEDMFALYFVLE